MPRTREQAQEWSGEFGRKYTERNLLTVTEFDAMYKDRFGYTRTQLNEQFLSGLDKSIDILEVGCNVGLQLQLLQKMGFERLHGIELQDFAGRVLKSRARDISVALATGLRTPFQADSFDLVFTSGVLIHVDPAEVEQVMAEIHRCSRQYIWGLEYYSDKYTEIEYRGHRNLLWKADFASLYLARFKDLELIKESRLRYLDNPDNADSMFLLRKH
jgi:pseudaminic acid biosynthesis-associated methylase